MNQRGDGGGRRVVVDDGTSLYVEVSAPAGTPEGSPVALIHGGLVHAVTWEPLAAYLARRRRVITYDVRGYGRSDRPADPAAYSMERSARDLAAILDAVGTGPAHVLGFSQGGMIALALAAQRPDLVRSLILVSTTARTTPEQAALFRQRAGDLEREGAGREADVYLTRAFAPDFREQNPDLIREYAAIVRSNDARAVAATFRALADFDGREAAAAVQCPALILAGELDAGMPPDPHARMLARLLPDARLVVVPGAGHTLHIEAPQVFRERVIGFIDQVDGVTGGANSLDAEDF